MKFKRPINNGLVICKPDIIKDSRGFFSETFKKNELDFCLVGEPSSSDSIGDVIRNGRRGSITGHLTIFGVQGHVAYPEKAKNPIHLSSKILSQLLDIKFDNGNEYLQRLGY